MTTFISVRANNHPHAGTFTPGRAWLNGVQYRLEVVSDEKTKAQQDEIFPTKSGVRDPAARAIELAAGPWIRATDGKGWVVDPSRICESGVKHIKENRHLSTLEGSDVDSTASKAAVDAARAVAARANEQLMDAELAIADLKAQVDALQVDARMGKELAETHDALLGEHKAVLQALEDARAENAELLTKLAPPPGGEKPADADKGDGKAKGSDKNTGKGGAK